MNTVTRSAARASVAMALSVACVGLVSGPVQAETTGPFLFENAMTGLCIDLPDYGLGSVDGPVGQWYCQDASSVESDNQFFFLTSTGPEGTFVIRNYKDGYCLDLPNNRTNLLMERVAENYCMTGSGDNEEFRFGESIGTARQIVHVQSGLCLDVEGVNAGPDARLALYHCSATDDHYWNLRPVRGIRS